MEITSKSNKILKLAKSLQQKKVRRNENLFIIEGEKLINEAILSNVKIYYLFYKTDERLNFKLSRDTQTYEISEDLMKSICTTDSAPPYLAIAEMIKWEKENLEKSSLILILDTLQDAGNLGTIIRTSEACNVDYIITSNETVDLFNPKVVRSSMGSIFRQPVIYKNDLKGFIKNLEGWKFIFTSPYAKDNFYNLNYLDKTALVIGTEARGVSQNLFPDSYQSVKIPMYGKVESLNTSIATSILLYEILRQRN